MPPWLPRVVRQVRARASARRVRFTLKALRELSSLGAGLDEDDACDVLSRLSSLHFVERLSSEASREWMYVFKPVVAGERVYLKVILRADCIVISFHEDAP